MENEENKNNQEQASHKEHQQNHHHTPNQAQHHNHQEQPKAPGWFGKLMIKLKDFYTSCSRVLRVTKKPSSEELKTIVKVSGIGILIIGLVGFSIGLLKYLFTK